MSFYEFIHDLFRAFPLLGSEEGLAQHSVQITTNTICGITCLLFGLGLFFLTYRVKSVPGRSTWYLTSNWVFMIGLLFLSRAMAFNSYNFANLDAVLRIITTLLGLVVVVVFPLTIVKRIRRESLYIALIKKSEEVKQATMGTHERVNQLEELVQREIEKK